MSAPLHPVEAYRRGGEDQERAAALGPGNTPTSPLLPGCALPLDRLFTGTLLDAAGDE